MTSRIKPPKWSVTPGLLDPEYRNLWPDLRSAIPFWEGAGKPYDYAQRRMLGVNAENPIAWTTTSVGGAYDHDETGDEDGNSILVEPTGSLGDVVNDTEGTIIIYCVLRNWTNAKVIHAINRGSNNDSQALLTNGTSTEFRYALKPGASNTITHTTTGWTLDTPVVVALTGGPGGNAIWRDGVKLTPSYTDGNSSTADWVGSLTGLTSWSLGWWNIANNHASEHDHIAYLYSKRQWSDETIRRVSRDPFGFFRMADEAGVVYALPIAPAGRIMSSLAGSGGLAHKGGMAGIGGGLAG